MSDIVIKAENLGKKYVIGPSGDGEPEKHRDGQDDL